MNAAVSMRCERAWKLFKANPARTCVELAERVGVREDQFTHWRTRHHFGEIHTIRTKRGLPLWFRRKDGKRTKR